MYHNFVLWKTTLIMSVSFPSLFLLTGPIYCLQVKNRYISYAQLAEDWLSESDRILHMPFLDTAYSTALESAEQFLWGDHDMDSVCFFPTKHAMICVEQLSDLYLLWYYQFRRSGTWH